MPLARPSSDPAAYPCAAVDARDQESEETTDPVQDLRERRDRVRTEMGGARRIE